jgi:hypothetical protein
MSKLTGRLTTIYVRTVDAGIAYRKRGFPVSQYKIIVDPDYLDKCTAEVDWADIKRRTETDMRG